MLKSYKLVHRHVECTPINQYDQFLSQFMGVCLNLFMNMKTKINYINQKLISTHFVLVCLFVLDFCT